MASTTFSITKPMSPTRKKPATNRLCRPMNAPRYGKRLRFSICPFSARSFSFRALPFSPFLGFAVFGIFYSAPPRFKTKPILDSASNVLYIFPGALAFYLSGAQDLSPQLFGAAWCWAMAMHAYSAVPDITADKSNGLQTVATLLGFRGTLFFCLMLYALATTLSFSHLGALSVHTGRGLCRPDVVLTDANVMKPHFCAFIVGFRLSIRCAAWPCFSRLADANCSDYNCVKCPADLSPMMRL